MPKPFLGTPASACDSPLEIASSAVMTTDDSNDRHSRYDSWMQEYQRTSTPNTATNVSLNIPSSSPLPRGTSATSSSIHRPHWTPADMNKAEPWPLRMRDRISKQYQHTRDIVANSCWHNKRRRSLIFGCLGLLILIVTALMLTFYLYVPAFIQRSFAGEGEPLDYPRMDFSLLLDDKIYFNVTTALPFRSIAPTVMTFQEPITFQTGGIDVFTMDFPTLHIRANHDCPVKHNFTVSIINRTHWELLWHGWVAKAFNGSREAMAAANVLPYNETRWYLRSRATVDMLGFRWTDIDVRRQMDWSGGLTSGTSPKIKLLDWDLTGGLKDPGLRLNLTYSSAGNVGLNLGHLSLSLAQWYKQNNTLTTPVNIVNVSLPNFNYLPGSHQFIIENQVQIRTPNSVRAMAQIVTNFMRNDTSVMEIRSFSVRYPWQQRGAAWLNNVLSTVTYIITLNRKDSLSRILLSRAQRFGLDFTANMQQMLPDVGDDEVLMPDGQATSSQ